MMKMPGPLGVITVHGDPDLAVECEDNGTKLADTVITEERDNTVELAKYPVDRNDPSILEKPTELDSSAATFKPTTNTRQVDLVENDSSRQKNKTWRMCIDYTSLNRACPKDPFVLLRIDQIIDAVAGSELLCFHDAYSGYNQIKMAVEDQEETTFITPLGAYCYTAMTFGLRNAGATYQRCMNNCLESQIGRNVHVYIDDVVVKSTRQDDLVADLAETFANLRRYQIKLNPLKCTFGVPSGQLLGYDVSKRGIEPNPENTSAVMRTKRPTCLLDAQRLAGRVATLSRFIPRLSDKAMPLYRLLKKSDSFEWTDEAQKALEELQNALRNGPVLAAPLPQETMLLYVAASNRAISAVMVVERKEEGKEQLTQRPVYYISEALIESKQRYPHYQQLVVASTPLADIIRNRDATGRIAKWAVELGVHNITYESCHAVKSQALADFLADWEEAQQPRSSADLKHWTLHFDGSKNLEGAGAGVVLTLPKGDIVRYVLQLRFEPCTNNMADYEALLHGMHVAKEMSATRLRCLGDSDLVASQTSGTCNATDINMIAYKKAIDQAGASFADHAVEWVDRCKNEEADALARLGSRRLPPPPGVFLDIITHSSVRAPREVDIAEQPTPDSVLVAVVSDAAGWTEPYMNYLERQVLPTDEAEARMIMRRCKSFTIINNELYKRSISSVFQRCVTSEEGRKILRDIHAGDCGHHAGARSIVAKALRHGFYWPTAHSDAVDLVRACVGCQKYASQSHMPGSALKTIPLTWPFAVWGMDMVGKFKTAPSGYTHLLVAVDKFTKWVEAKPIKKCDGKTATKFLWELIYRYGYPHSIITDNGTNFSKGEMADFCEENGIRLDLASVTHPESNGQAERAN
nr:uncharacterized protein LOC127340450 [Lolium perenne]